MSWIQEFKNHTTSGAFHLNLSGEMIFVLQLLENDQIARAVGSGFGRFIPAVRALRRRGLVIHFDPPYEGKSHQITEAGEHVLALLRIAELIKKEAT